MRKGKKKKSIIEKENIEILKDMQSFLLMKNSLEIGLKKIITKTNAYFHQKHWKDKRLHIFRP